MILSELNRLLVNIANSNYLVNDAFVGDVYTINGKENKFGCFVATPMSAVKYAIGTIRYTYILYYIDRLTKDEANIDFIQSDAVSVLKGIIDFMSNNGIEIGEGYEFTLFREKFSDWCAGAYVNVTMVVQDNECGEGDFNTDGIDLRPLIANKNGIYEPGSFDGYNKVTINVPQAGATEEWVDEEIALKLEGYATEEWVQSQGYLTEHQDLSDYATKEYVDDEMDELRGEIPSLDGYATQNWVNSQGFLKSANLSGYATKNYVNNQGFLKSADLTGYATETWVENHGYLTSIPAGYATETWVRNQGYLTSIPAGYATQTWVQNQGYLTSIPSQYATKNYVNNQGFLKEADLTGYATKNWIENQGYISGDQIEEALAPYATIELLSTTLEDYATMSWVDTEIDLKLTGYATQSWVESQGYLTEHQDLSAYATMSWVSSQGYLTSIPSEYATQSWVLSQNYITSTALSGYATQSWVESQGYLTEHQDLSAYATMSWVESQSYITSAALSGYATESWVQSQGYLTEHQDISGKMDKSEVWSGSIDDWVLLTPEEQCSYTIALITE